MGEAAPFDQGLLAATAFKLLSEDPRFKVGEAEIRGNIYRVFENAPPHLRDFFAYAAATHGDKEFLIFDHEGREALSFAETWSRACRFANALEKELGVKKGDPVAIAMRNFPEWCVAYMAIISLGAIVVPLNAWWKEHELEYGLKDSGARIVVVDKRRLDYLKPCKEKHGLTLILAREEGAGADYRLKDMIDGESDATPPAGEIQPDDDFCIVYTSGSTGEPKGVVLTHRSAISALMSWGFVGAILKDMAGGVSPFGDNPGILLAVPLFHVTGSHAIFLFSMLIGRRMAIMYRWDAKDAVEMINREELTNFVGVPSQSFELMEAAGGDGLPSLLDIGSGGARRPAEQVRKLAAKFKGNPSSGYGLSETNGLGCIISKGDYQLRPDSTGKPVPPLTDIKIMKDGAERPRGEVGEVWIRTPANFRGYHNLPEETEKALTPDGWFRSGDLGKMDEEGFLYIVDRIKDLIIRGGENVSCLEVENRVYEHEGIAEAVVFSVPDQVLGEKVGLVFYPKEGSNVDPAVLRGFIAEKLAAFKVPERIWISPAALPRLGTAKFDKLTVKKIALQHPPALSV